MTIAEATPGRPRAGADLRPKSGGCLPRHIQPVFQFQRSNRRRDALTPPSDIYELRLKVVVTPTDSFYGSCVFDRTDRHTNPACFWIEAQNALNIDYHSSTRTEFVGV